MLEAIYGVWNVRCISLLLLLLLVLLLLLLTAVVVVVVILLGNPYISLSFK